MSRGGAAPRILRFAEGRRMPWRNGGGETVEVAVHPPEAAPEDFGWRVSVATIVRDGPFSTFEGIDRTFMLLDGAGVTLTVGAGPPVRFDRDGDPLRFAGEAPCRCALSGRPATALNVMTRRGSFDCSVARLGRDRGLPRIPGAITLLVCGEDGCDTDLSTIACVPPRDPASSPRETQQGFAGEPTKPCSGPLGPLDVLIVPAGAEVGVEPGASSARMVADSIWPAIPRRPARGR